MTVPEGLPGEGEGTQNPAVDFASFYMSEMPALVAFTMRLGADLNEAHDIAQEAFVNAFPRWLNIAHPRAYLRTSASREFIRRSCNAIREKSVADVPDMLAMPDLSVAKVEFRDQEVRVFQAITGLPERQRQVIAWTLDGFTPAEISAILGVSAGAVRGSLLKARRELKVKLNIAEGGDGDV
jgi:RNA polymerase sigma factor (sigma-70 family)